MVACKSTKDLHTGPIPVRTQKEVHDALLLRNIDFNHFSGKADFSFENSDQGGSGSLQLRLVRDSIIWLVIKKFGIEAARTLITPDSAFVLYRFDRVCQQGSLFDISNKFGIDLSYQDIQELLAGNIMLPYGDEITAFSQDGAHCKLTCKLSGLNVIYSLSAFDLTLEEAKITDEYKRMMTIKYSDYRKNKGVLIPFKRNIYAKSDLIKTSNLDIEFDEIELNIPKAITFKIPESYDRYAF